jgi:hypothetical protein
VFDDLYRPQQRDSGNDGKLEGQQLRAVSLDGNAQTPEQHCASPQISKQGLLPALPSKGCTPLPCIVPSPPSPTDVISTDEFPVAGALSRWLLIPTEFALVGADRVSIFKAVQLWGISSKPPDRRVQMGCHDQPGTSSFAESSQRQSKRFTLSRTDHKCGHFSRPSGASGKARFCSPLPV